MAVINFKIEEEKKDLLKKISDREYRSITSLIMIALEEKYPELKNKK